MVAELTALRDQIDEVDKALLSLLAKRLELVAEVGEVKSQYGLPIYVPERESAMLASRREEAAALGVPPDLIEDVLRRVMRESYSSENDKGFKTLQPNLRPVVIVGGGGQMGRLFEKMLTLSGYQVRILEKTIGPGRRISSPMPAWLSSAYLFTPPWRRSAGCRPFRRIAFWLTLPR
ncbi:chorismate mutase [Klebsiella pneumoniae subsp. pneumoniae]|nr:chorismate mutase [Klebsiella pneumoniae subsp. pneumoniae]